MQVLDDGRIRCRVRITGTYKGNAFEYTDPEDDEGSQFIWPNGDPSTFWWSEGNMACDCNRAKYLPEAWGVEDECGHEICIDRIEPVDYDGPVLELNETVESSV